MAAVLRCPLQLRYASQQTTEQIYTFLATSPPRSSRTTTSVRKSDLIRMEEDLKSSGSNRNHVQDTEVECSTRRSLFRLVCAEPASVDVRDDYMSYYGV